MIKKTKFSTITAVVATIAAIAAMGSIGGGIGLGQQQMALAQPVDPRDIGGDIGDIGDTVRNILGDNDDPDPETELCSGPDELFVLLPDGRGICINTNFTMNPLPEFP
jgi:hypothetical protein